MHDLFHLIKGIIRFIDKIHTICIADVASAFFLPEILIRKRACGIAIKNGLSLFLICAKYLHSSYGLVPGQQAECFDSDLSALFYHQGRAEFVLKLLLLRSISQNKRGGEIPL